MRKLLKKINVMISTFVLSISNVLLITNANAAISGGWSLGNPVAQGASTVYDGTKKLIIDGKDYIKKGTAKITPTATGVAKVLARGGAGFALSVAVEQLIGAVDWVLDPANNQIRYTKPQDPTNVPPDSPVCWTWNGGTCESLDAVVRKILATNLPGWTLKSYTCPAASSVKTPGVRITCDAVLTYPGWPDKTTKPNPLSVANPNYDPNALPQDEEKTIPLETVAQKVISNAESGDTNAQVATGAAAADVVAEAESDQTGVKARPIVQQLEDTAKTTPADEAAAEKANEATGTQTQNPTKPDTTDLKLEFPIFCNWAPTVCEAAQTVISFPKTLTEWWTTGKEKAESWATSVSEAWTETKEWVKSEEGLPEKDTTDINLPDVPIVPKTVNVNWGSSCPAPTTTPITFLGVTHNITIMRYDFICEWAWVVKLSVTALASISAVYIISGRKV